MELLTVGCRKQGETGFQGPSLNWNVSDSWAFRSWNADERGKEACPRLLLMRKAEECKSCVSPSTAGGCSRNDRGEGTARAKTMTAKEGLLHANCLLSSRDTYIWGCHASYQSRQDSVSVSSSPHATTRSSTTQRQLCQHDNDSPRRRKHNAQHNTTTRCRAFLTERKWRGVPSRIQPRFLQLDWDLVSKAGLPREDGLGWASRPELGERKGVRRPFSFPLCRSPKDGQIRRAGVKKVKITRGMPS